MRSPWNSTTPASARICPVRMLKNVDLPAPFGPMSARISPRPSTTPTPSTARTPPKCLRTPSTRRTTAPSLMRARPERAEDAARKREDDDHEDRAEHELPVHRVLRDDGVEQLVDGGADGRARKRREPAEQHHHQRLDGHRHVDVRREHAALAERE